MTTLTVSTTIHFPSGLPGGLTGVNRPIFAFVEITAGEGNPITHDDATDRYLFQAGAAVNDVNLNTPGDGVGARHPWARRGRRPHPRCAERHRGTTAGADAVLPKGPA